MSGDVDLNSMGLWERISWSVKNYWHMITLAIMVTGASAAGLGYYARAEAETLIEIKMEEPLQGIQESLEGIVKKQGNYDEKFRKLELERAREEGNRKLFQQQTDHKLQLILQELQKRTIPTQ